MESEQLKRTETTASARPAVLYVDNEQFSIKHFVGAFERDFPVFTASSAADAEDVLASKSDQVGILITEQRMPVQTGVQLLDHVKAQYPDIVRFLTTAYADMDDAVAAVNRGEIYRYIQKPWDVDALRAELHNAMELYRRRRYEKDLLQARRRTIISLASHIAHELSTPLATIHTAVSSIRDYLPDLVLGYRHGVEAGLADAVPQPMLELLDTIPGMILSVVERTNMLIRILLMNAAEDAEDHSGYVVFSVRQCINDALRTYPFQEVEENLIAVDGGDFDVLGSELLLSYVIYNLLKNSFDAIKEAGKGEIRIRLEPGEARNQLFFRDTGSGISHQVLPHVFEEFYSGKGIERGTGMGLPFCRRVMTAFGGNIECRSREGEYTELELAFPKIEE